MSFYNIIHGVNPMAVFLLPMLGKTHPNSYPRFRDCFLKDEEHPEYDNHIQLYTRVGGGNREDYQEQIKEMQSHPNYVADFDDDFDNTYATFVFSVPEAFKSDFDLIGAKKIKDVSRAYKQRVRDMFPILEEQLKKIWPEDSE